MADSENNHCDLCQRENRVGPMKFAHKPFLFHFYHSRQYEEAREEFQANPIRGHAAGSNESSENEEEGEEEEYDDGDEEREGTENEEPSDDEINEELSADEREEEEEEAELIDKPDTDERDSDNESLEIVGDEDVADDVTDDEEDVDDSNEKADSDEEPEKQLNKEIIPAPVLTSIITDVNTLMCNTIDITMAAGVGIMAGIVSMTSRHSPSQNSAASFLTMESVSKTCIGTALAALGMVAGIKEILNAVNEKPPDLPNCECCKKCELQQPGCKIFCETCGECEQGSYWKDGDESRHCLRICNDCNTNCVLCEEKVATVRRHHKAFEINVHGRLSARLYGTFRDARIFGSSLIIAGILTCLLPGISWAWGVGLVAGSVIANSGIRIIAKPTVRIRCDSCHLEEGAGMFEESKGCQVWCQCCGVNADSNGEKYCLALCETCSHD